ncbi:MAG: NADP(H)-dependent aldo-keto reductase [Gammaproteobacteria bacterium]|nr:NADP(H)-dependent aldo-keto reductase [Gammaproteobacteria bacterium]
MLYRKLGNTHLDVSVICLGTMTFGKQNSPADAFAQMNYALDQGVNFFDTAELYAIPPTAETYGKTETIIGSWLQQQGQRDNIILASKIAGPGPDWIPHIRHGETRFNKKYIGAALDASLARLQTDYIDLYQLHWPERKTNFFGQLGYQAMEDEFTAFTETLAALNEQIQAGKIRYIGLSNETAWGVMRFLNAHENHPDLPRIASVQNPYCLLNRSYEIGLAEVSWREQLGLLAYSPLGFGVLSGKYLNNEKPEAARLTLFPDYNRYSNEQAMKATQLYTDLARQHQLDPAQMALAYVNSRPFLTSTIIGATTMDQLKANIASIDIVLSQEVIAGIESIHATYPNPCP